MLNLKRYFDFGTIANKKGAVSLLITKFDFPAYNKLQLIQILRRVICHLLLAMKLKLKYLLRLSDLYYPLFAAPKQHGTVHTAMVPHPLMVALPYISRFSEQLHVKTWDFLNWITFLVMKERTSKMKKWKIAITTMSSKGHLYLST